MTLSLLAAQAAEAAGPEGAVRWVWLAVALPFLGFLVNGALALRRPQARSVVSMVGAGVLLGAFAVAALVYLQLRSHPPETPVLVELWRWIPSGALDIRFALQVDQLSTVMLLVVTGVGSLIHLFSIGYMGTDPGYARYFAYLNLFVAFMLVLVLGSSLPVLFVGWEGVGLCSYLLIGFWYGDKANADAGKKAFLMNRIGDCGVLIAMFLLWYTTRSLDFTAIAAKAPTHLVAGGGLVTAITLFLFLGCVGKSAQIPLYTRLPDAMAGPTPVSALIHAATMVTAGVYLVARTGILFAMAPFSSAVVAGVGALTALFAASIGLRQYDIKKVLAYSTISQLGFMFLAVGTGAYVAGIFHLVTHAFFKALLFLGAGSVIHAMHHAYHATHAHADAQDMRNMGGLRRYLPWTFWLMLLATFAIAGVPGFSGFFSKDEILAAAFGRGQSHPLWLVFWGMAMLAAFMTAFYMMRLIAMTFLGENRTGAAEQEYLHDAPPVMTGPLVILGILSVAGGLLNLPAFAGGHHALETWLTPVMAAAQAVMPVEMPHGSTEWLLIAAAVTVALIGLLLGWRTTLARPIPTAAAAAPETGFARVLFRKYYVDEIYDALIVRPVVGISRLVLWKGVDQGLIDGVGANGSASLARGLGWIGSRLQSGQLGFYMVVFLVGAVWLLRAVAR
ncbi:MAG TPA: NADH-quinone oxidoreductase subunit L [Gemmatimonadales bacterium]|nr:NADH-quinone oxidoreductase subunit L [Gemmatimonadales bacterium]